MWVIRITYAIGISSSARSLDKVFDCGCELLFGMVAAFGCRQEKVDQRFNSLDSTSFSLEGDYSIDENKSAIHITDGHSKDHRPDLKQVMLELMVSQDGGVPFVSKSWDGNASACKPHRVNTLKWK